MTYDILSIISNHLKEYPYSLEVKENMCRFMAVDEAFRVERRQGQAAHIGDEGEGRIMV